MNEWQSIDTAPKDGTRILLAEDKIVDVGHYFDTSYEQEELVSQKGKKRIYELVKYVRGYWDTPEGIFNPTHWMPLPPAPPKKRDE